MSGDGFIWLDEERNKIQPTVESVITTIKEIVKNITNGESNESFVAPALSTTEATTETTLTSLINEVTNPSSDISNAISTSLEQTTSKIGEENPTSLFPSISSSIFPASESVLNAITTAATADDTILGVTASTSESISEFLNSNLSSIFTTEEVDLTQTTQTAVDEITSFQTVDIITEFSTFAENITTKLDGLPTTATNSTYLKQSETNDYNDVMIYLIIGISLLIFIIITVFCYIFCRKCCKNYKPSGDYFVTQLTDYNQTNGKSQSSGVDNGTV